MKPAIFFLKLFCFACLVFVAGWQMGRHAAPSAPAGTTAAIAPAKQLWTCGMHPQILLDHPGDCPICGMKLTPVRPDADPSMATIHIDPVTSQNMGVRTAVVQRGPVRQLVRTVGVVDYAEPAVTDVTTKFKGWITKLYVNSTGQLVHAGEPLFEIYSPELYSAQSEYLQTRGRAPSKELDFLQSSARTKLKFFDVSDAQIAALDETGVPIKTLPVLAPHDGFVIEKNVVAGQMVEGGMRLFRLGDLGTVWVLAQVYEQDLPALRVGQEATVALSYLPDRQFRGQVTYVYPAVDDKTRTGRVRIALSNPGYLLKPGMFAAVSLATTAAGDAVLVPDEAVLRSGAHNTVFIAQEGGRFAPRAVTLGLHAEGDYYQVLDGLSAGEKVVTSAQFLFDSESQLREAIQKLRAPSAAGVDTGTGRPVAPVAAVPDSSAPTASGAAVETVYVCPMPEHVSITYNHPGKCPLCAMETVPVARELLTKLPAASAVEYYACPMPEHPLHYDHAGKCPLCGMTLVPVAQHPAPAAPPKAEFACPMPEHPIHYDHAGKCPLCGMKLIPVPAPAATPAKPAGGMDMDMHAEPKPATPK